MAIGPPTFDKAAAYCALQSIARQNGTDGKPAWKRDMLDDFLYVKHSNLEMMNDNTIVRCLLLNILASADTVSITLRAIIYYILKNPRVYRKLQQEINAAESSSTNLYAKAKNLIYLDAVIREAPRVHPGVGLLLERIVPAGDLSLPDGTNTPTGTIIGMNPVD